MKPDICIYHGNCADGFTAAWAVWRRFGDGVKFVPGVYGQEPPDVAGKHVLMVDFSYKLPVLDALAQTAKSIVVLDHHKTAADNLAPFRIELCGSARLSNVDVEGMFRDVAELGRPPILAEFDMERSGAQMTWDYLFVDKRPMLVEYVGDRDLWRFALPQSREIAAWVFSYGYTFKNWDFLHTRLRNHMDAQDVAEEGGAILRKQDKDVAELLAVTRRTMVIGGVKVPVANLPYTLASDAAGKMAESAPFAACYFDKPSERVFSLRSRGEDGADVSEVAKRYGGGGHKNAAGFQVPLGWEGDR